MTAMASSLDVRATGEVADGLAEAGNDAAVVADELVGLEVLSAEPSFEPQADRAKTAAKPKASARMSTVCRRSSIRYLGSAADRRCERDAPQSSGCDSRCLIAAPEPDHAADSIRCGHPDLPRAARS